MKTQNKLAALALAGLVTMTGCMDLEVQHPNAPDRERALRNVNDIEQLIAGGYRNYFNVGNGEQRIGPVLATIAYQHTATAANFGMVDFSYPGSARSTTGSRTVLRPVRQQLDVALPRGFGGDGRPGHHGEQNLTLPTRADGDRQARAQAYGYFVLGLAHGGAAMLFDQGYIYDPSIAIEDVELAPYTEVHAAAQSYLDRAIQEATGKTFTIPEQWMGREVRRRSWCGWPIRTRPASGRQSPVRRRSGRR
jgi:hypothetical protein